MYENLASLLIAIFATFELACSYTCRSENVKPAWKFNLNVAVFVPLPDEDHDPAFDQGYSIIPAVELAADQVNSRTDILPSIFHLNINVKNSGCDKASKTAVELVSVYNDLLVSKNAPLGIIGPACSEDSIFAINAFNRVRIFDLPVFYSGTTPNLSIDAEERENAFGMISSAAVLTDTLIRVAAKENWDWENIAVLYEDSRERFQDTYDALVRGLNSSQQVGYTRQIALSQIPLAEIIDRNIRIVVVFSSEESARQLVCLAGQATVNFVFPIRQFIFIERSFDDFLGADKTEFAFTQLSDGKMYYCDEKTVIRGLNGSILLNQALDSVDPDTVTVSNYTAREVKEQYKERLSECEKAMDMTLPESVYAYPYYDATWALALSLSLLFTRPSNEVLHNRILNNVRFQGISSWINFNVSNDLHVHNPVNMFQIKGSAAVVIGVWNGSELEYTSNTFISDEFMTMKVVLHPGLTILGFLSAFLSLLLIVILQVMNTFFRKYPSVKASSPRLNHFIFFGCYLLVSAIFMSTIHHIAPEISGLVFCNFDIFCSILGYCFIFATIFAKSWRTYRIFSHPFESQRFLRDSTLSILITLFILLGVLLFIPVLAVSPFDKSVSFMFDTSQWPPVKKLTTTCVAESVEYIAIPLLFQVILTVSTVFLATLNRNVRHTNFRTTKQIIVLVYLLAFVWLLGGPLLMILYLVSYSVNLTYLIYTTLLVVTVVLCQLVLMVPVLVLAVDARWKMSKTVKSRRGSWLRRLSLNTDTTYL